MKRLILLISLVLLPFASFASFAYTSHSLVQTISPSISITNPPVSEWPALIEGEWTPVDMAKGQLTFKYGIMVYKAPSEFGGGTVKREFPYSIRRDHLILDNRYPAIYGFSNHLDCPIKIYKSEGETYLEINSIIGLAGKYQKNK